MIQRSLLFVVLSGLLLGSVSVPVFSQSENPDDPGYNTFLPPFATEWTYTFTDREETGYQVGILSNPVIDGPRLFVASASGRLICFFKDSGQISWQFTAPRPVTMQLATTDTLVMLSDSQRVYALDKRTGTPVWINTPESTLTAGLLHSENNVIFADSTGSAVALNIADGTPAWTWKPTGSQPAGAVRSELFLTDGRIIMGNEAGLVVSLSVSSGSQQWAYQAEGAVRSGFASMQNRLFFGSMDNHVYSIDLTNGTLRWRQRTAGDVHGRPVLDDTYVYIASRDKSIRILNQFNGFPPPGAPIGLQMNFDVRPLRTGDYLVFPQETTLQLRNVMSRYRPTTPYYANGEITTDLVFDNESKSLYAGYRDGRLMVIRPASLISDDLRVADVAAAFDLPRVDPVLRQEQKNRTRRKVTVQADTEQSITSASTEPSTADSGDVKEPGDDAEESPVSSVASQFTGSSSDQPENSVADLTAVDPGPLLQQARENLVSRDLQRAGNLFTDALRVDATKRYTINLGLYCIEDSIFELLDALSDEDVLIFPREFRDAPCYFICIGLYDSREAAEQAIQAKQLGRRISADINALRIDSFIPGIE